jgi:hypothetical protein
LFAGYFCKCVKKLGEDKLKNDKSENDKKLHSAVRLKEARNGNDELKNCGAKPRKSMRSRDGINSNEITRLSSLARMHGGLFSKYRRAPARMKSAVPIIARSSNAILTEWRGSPRSS